MIIMTIGPFVAEPELVELIHYHGWWDWNDFCLSAKTVKSIFTPALVLPISVPVTFDFPIRFR